MTTNLQRASLISRHVELEVVNLAEARLNSTLDPLAVPDSMELQQSFRCRYELREKHPNSVFVYVDFRFEAIDEAEERKPLVELRATYVAVYRLKGAATYPADALQYFADLNGAYNVWPYWRELVQTVAGRVGLAAIVVPVFKPQVREIKIQENLDLDSEEPQRSNETAISSP